MSAKDKRALRRFVKVALAALVAQAGVWVQQGMPPVDYKFFAVPILGAVLLAAEKWLQKEKKVS